MAKGKKESKDIMAIVLADASILGVEQAAKSHGFGRATVFRWKKQALEDPELRRLETIQKRKLLDSYTEDTKKYFKVLLHKATELVPELTAEHFYQLQGAIKISGELINDFNVIDSLSVGNDESTPTTIEVPAVAEAV